MSHEKFVPHFTPSADKLAALRAAMPEAFTADGQVNWDALRTALGETVTDESPQGFGLRWPGKRAAQRAAHTPIPKTIAPQPGHGVDEETTRNLFIEGDNLDALKLLRKAYHKRVKMIYIDPPYNTGNDFIYKDDFSESVESFEARTGARDDEGNRLVANAKSSGRFHSDWLSMIYPRLLLARELLRDDGVIFVSIDDNEVHHLRLLMDEVFGPENFVVQLIWRSRQFTDTRSNNGVSIDHEYLVLYSLNPDFSMLGTERDESKFSNPDNDLRGPWMSRSILGLANALERPNLHFAIVDPATGNIFNPPPNTGWRYSRQRMEAMIDEGRIIFPKNPDGRPREKKFRSDIQKNMVSIGGIIDGIFTAHGTAEIRDLFGQDFFGFPKPSKLIRLLVKQASDPDAIILDFFAGSGTTAEAVLRLNQEDGGRRRFVLVQLPEPTDNLQFPTIAEIAKERIRRVAARLKAESTAQLPLADAAPPDLGFRVLRVADSHFKRWADVAADADDAAYQLALEDAVDSPLRPGWTHAGLLTELLLQEGFPLDADVERLPDLPDADVRRVRRESSPHALFVCLDERILARTVDALPLTPQDSFLCFDAALSDEAKLRLADRCRLKTF